MYAATVTGRDSADLAAANYTTFLDLRNTLDNKVTCDTTVTVSSMTDCTWTAYGSRTVSAAATPIWQNGQMMTGKVTTTTSAALVFDLPGLRYFRLGFVPSGTTNATDDVVVTCCYNDYLTSAAADGALRVD